MKRSERPAKLAERLSDNRHARWVIAEQVRARVIYRGGVAANEDQAERQWVGAQRPVSLSRDDGVNNVQDLALRRVAHRRVAAPIKQHAVQIKPRAPDGIVARPGPLDAELIARSHRYAIEVFCRVVPELAR